MYSNLCVFLAPENPEPVNDRSIDIHVHTLVRGPALQNAV